MGAGAQQQVHLTIIADAMTEIVASLRSAPPSPRVRELRSRAATFERVVGAWAFRPPSGAQVTAMLDCVMELHAMVMGPRASLRPPAPWGGAPVSGRPGRQSVRPTAPPRGPKSVRPTHMRTTRPPPPTPASKPPHAL